MKTTVTYPNEQKKFKPVTISITCETEEELATLYAKLNGAAENSNAPIGVNVQGKMLGNFNDNFAKLIEVWDNRLK